MTKLRIETKNFVVGGHKTWFRRMEFLKKLHSNIGWCVIEHFDLSYKQNYEFALKKI